MRHQTLGLCFLVLFTLSASTMTAEVVAVRLMPPNPTPRNNITLLITTDNICDGISDAVREGNHFRIGYGVIPILCGGGFSFLNGVDLGSLPAGTYTFEIVGSSSPLSTGTFVVAQAALPDAPTLSPAALAALSLVLAGAAWFFIGRQT